MLLLKAQVKGSDQADLFGQTTQVHAHVRDGRIVRPYLAIRHKAPPAAPLPEVHVHPAKPMMVVTKPTEPPHLAEGRRIYEGYKAKKAARAARGLGDSLGTASDEHSFALWEKRLAADPSKWKPGMGVSYQVSGGARMQTNRGFRLVSVDAAGKRGVVRSVADTGITTTGGDHDRLDDAWIYLGELKREKKYDAQ